MSADSVILLCFLSAIVATLLGVAIAFRLRPSVIQQTVDSSEQEKAKAILVYLEEANAELEAAINVVNSITEIHKGATIKEQLDALTKRAFRLKDRYSKQVEKLAGRWVEPAPAEQKGANGSKPAPQKVQEAMATASASLGRKVGFKEIIRALGEINSSIRTVEDFAKLDASKQDSALSAALARVAKTSETTTTTTTTTSDPWETIVTPAPKQ